MFLQFKETGGTYSWNFYGNFMYFTTSDYNSFPFLFALWLLIYEGRDKTYIKVTEI
jgi:hypothetical protein